MSAEEEALLWRIVRWRNRRWEGEQDYEDIISESLLSALRAYRKQEAQGSRYPMAVVGAAARRGAANWYRDWIGHPGKHCKERFQLRLSLEDLILHEQDEDDCQRLPHSEGFEAEVVERLWGEWLWAQARAATTPRRYETLRLMMAGKTQREAGEALGIGERGAEANYYRALDQCREALR